MRPLFESRTLDALARTLVGFAILHQVLLIAYAVTHRDSGVLNIFTMVEAHRWFPALAGAGAQLLSLVLALAVYGLVYVFLTRPGTRVARVEAPPAPAPGVSAAPPGAVSFRPTAWSGILVFFGGILVHNACLTLIERFTTFFPSVTDVVMARLPYIAFGVPGELCFVAFLLVVVTLMFRSQAFAVPAVLTQLGMFYAVRGLFLFLLPIGSPVGAPALEDRFVFYPWANHGYFPGGHAGLMTIMSLSVLNCRWRRVLLAATVLFAFGTILARTHYTADALGGLLIGYAIVSWGRKHLAVVQRVQSPVLAPAREAPRGDRAPAPLRGVMSRRPTASSPALASEPGHPIRR